MEGIHRAHNSSLNALHCQAVRINPNPWTFLLGAIPNPPNQSLHSYSMAHSLDSDKVMVPHVYCPKFLRILINWPVDCDGIGEVTVKLAVHCRHARSGLLTNALRLQQEHSFTLHKQKQSFYIHRQLLHCGCPPSPEVHKTQPATS